MTTNKEIAVDQVVYVLYIHTKTYQEVLGIYSTEDKAKEFIKSISPQFGWESQNVFILKRVVE